MQTFWDNYLATVGDAATILLFAYLSLLISWPLFLLLEKIMPVIPNTPRENYWLNWRITASNFLLAPAFTAAVTLFTAAVAQTIGLGGLSMPVMEFSFAYPLLNVLLQGTVIFFIACFLGDIWYYWWHRWQHTIPFLWEMHKLHHSDENLNATSIYRSHFLEPAGQAMVRGLTIGLVFDLSDTPQTTVAIIAGGLLLALWDYFIHANVRIDTLHRMLPYFSTPQYHWIHHSKFPQHQDKNFAIWLPIFDRLFGTYYKPAIDEYPPTGLSSGEKIETWWVAQTGPLIAWAKAARIKLLSPRPQKAAQDEQ